MTSPTKRLSTPYPRIEIEEILQAEEEDTENETENYTTYHGQSKIIGPKPKRGYGVFADILNKEWELEEGRVYPASTQTHTAQPGILDDGGHNELPSLMYPMLLVLPRANSSAGGDGEPEDKEEMIQRATMRKLGFSVQDTDLVARYLARTPEAPSLEQWVPQWARAAEAAAVYRPTTEDQGALIFQSQGLPAVKPLAKIADPELLEPIVPIDLDLVFRYDGGVLYIEYPAV